MKSYTILSPFKDADGTHKPGEPDVSLSDKDAAELIEIGAVQEAQVAAQPTVPTDPAERQAAIVDAIGKMDKENADIWLKDNRPDATAIAAITGWPVTAAERNAAWATLNP